jgi:dTDP-4-amino-4,6-dideoxygalactose transaminase
MHLSGSVLDMQGLYKIKKKYNSILIEDACHALGSKYIFKGELVTVGKCQHSDISVFSLHPLKTITTGEGGLVSTNNKNIYKKLCLLRSHGIERNNKKYWEYNIVNLGFNYRLSDVNCALGISQANKLASFLKKRKIIAKRYISLLKPLNKYIKTPSKYEIKNSANHLFIISVNFKYINATKEKFIAFMNKRNIFPQFHYIPIFKFDCFKSNQIINFKNSINYYENAISIPIYYNLSLKQQKYVTESINQFVNSKKN